MQHTSHAKSTLYNGIYFRSKLEAQWAYLFDLSGFTYIYEPFEINYRIPKFIITCSDDIYNDDLIIVEIKHEIFIDDFYVNLIFDTYKNNRAHILILSENTLCCKGSKYINNESCEMNDFTMTDFFDYDENLWNQAYNTIK